MDMGQRNLAGPAATILAINLILSGCQTKPEITADPLLNPENAAMIYVYRPSSQWMGLAIDYRVSLDDRYIGSLETGGYIRSYAEPGERAVTVQSHFLTIPDGRPFTLRVKAKAGEEYYIRFSQNIDSIVMMSGTVVTTGHNELHLVPYEVWQRRR